MTARPSRRIATVAVLVADQDAAIRWYRDCLRLDLLEDVPLGGGKRWVVLGTPDGGARILLARAEGDTQQARIGDQTGGRVFLFLETDDFDRDHAAMLSRGVVFLEQPRREAYGTVAVFEDLHGNRWDLIEPRRDA
ncbi:VOC family protein [Aquibium sp. ELW1220]|uniref:VOC family protein n=1 Tax=Aquibium sp. ELW1220 TaxID=2976766 RepID=UPI0025B1EDCF|nr:VOC family protein [Aquibium sp. ELW1220]MDN2580037.1 VOC family protein [Aquibium sp. ELW1220]